MPKPSIFHWEIEQTFQTDEYAGTIRGTLIWGKARKRNVPLLVLFVVPPLEGETEALHHFAEKLCKLGYACFILYPQEVPNGTPAEQDLHQNVIALNQTLHLFQSWEEKEEQITPEVFSLLDTQQIGLISYSRSAEFCLHWSEKHPDQLGVKGILSVAPAFTPIYGIGYPKIQHPFFVCLGNLDQKPKLPPWDFCRQEKAGVIINGGDHYSFFGEVISEELEEITLPSYPKITDDLQSEILLHCIEYFFHHQFSNTPPPLLRSLLSLQQNFEQEIHLLYQHPHQLLIEGTHWRKEENPSLTSWEGQLKINGKSIPPHPPLFTTDLDRDTDEKGQVIDQILYTGADNISGIFRFNSEPFKESFTGQVEKFIALTKKEEKSGISERTEKQALLQQIVSLLSKAVSSSDQSHLPFPKSALPIVQLVRNKIEAFIGESPIQWDEQDWQVPLQEKILNKSYAYSSITFFAEIISGARELAYQSWHHGALGREIIWKSNSAVYLIEKPFDSLESNVLSLNQYRYLSFRMGQSYLSNRNLLGNKEREDQVIQILFYDKASRPIGKPSFISIPFPCFRGVRNRDYLTLIHAHKTQYKKLKLDIGFKGLLTHHFVPLPPDIKSLHKIELHFQSESGAVMLSEVALTN